MRVSLSLVAEIRQSSEACQQRNQKPGVQHATHGTPTAWLVGQVVAVLQQLQPELFQQRTQPMAAVLFAFLRLAAVLLVSR
jgi:hypothetical protein